MRCKAPPGLPKAMWFILVYCKKGRHRQRKKVYAEMTKARTSPRQKNEEVIMSSLVLGDHENDLMPTCLLFPIRFVIDVHSARDLLQQET